MAETTTIQKPDTSELVEARVAIRTALQWPAAEALHMKRSAQQWKAIARSLRGIGRAFTARAEADGSLEGAARLYRTAGGLCACAAATLEAVGYEPDEATADAVRWTVNVAWTDLTDGPGVEDVVTYC